jgi:hypothetical protein
MNLADMEAWFWQESPTGWWELHFDFSYPAVDAIKSIPPEHEATKSE